MTSAVPRAMPRIVAPRALTALMCAYLGLTVLGFHGVAALLPGFMDLWHLSETEAGWLLGVMSLCSLLASPAIALTDRIDTRWLMLAGTGFNVVGYAGFGLYADGLVSAMFFRGLVGVGYVLTYMPGIKAMADRLAAGEQAQATATYVSSFSICSSLSVAVTGLVAGWAGWRWAFAVPVASNLLAAAIVLFMLAPARPAGAGAARAPGLGVFGWRAVTGNRASMGYVAGGFSHTVELLAMRGWTVAFLAFAVSLHPGAAPAWNLSLVATALILLGVPSGMAGGAIGARFGLARTSVVVMVLSALVAMGVGFSAALPFWMFFLGPLLLHNILVLADSGTLSAGMMGSADPARRGATVAFYTMVASVGSFVGPVLLGTVLDAAGGRASLLAWGLAFGSVGLIGLAAAFTLHRLAGGPGAR